MPLLTNVPQCRCTLTLVVIDVETLQPINIQAGLQNCKNFSLEQMYFCHRKYAQHLIFP